MAAFQFDRRTLLEDALKQIPNFQVSRDGSVYAFGKPITSVQVDGKKFFGGDVLTATRNLPADFIKNIQVIDFYGDEATAKGTKSGNSEKILNIILKEDKKKITFGQVTEDWAIKIGILLVLVLINLMMDKSYLSSVLSTTRILIYFLLDLRMVVALGTG